MFDLSLELLVFNWFKLILPVFTLLLLFILLLRCQSLIIQDKSSKSASFSFSYTQGRKYNGCPGCSAPSIIFNVAPLKNLN